MSHKIDRLDLGSAIIRSAKSTKSNNIPDPNPMPIKDGLRKFNCYTMIEGKPVVSSKVKLFGRVFGL